MKNQILKKNTPSNWFIIGTTVLILISFFFGYSINEKKNRAYINRTYPSMENLVRIKLERDMRRDFVNQSIQVLPDSQNHNLFYIIATEITTPHVVTIYKVDVSGIPNYFDLSNSINAYYPDKLKLILSTTIPKKTEQITNENNTITSSQTNQKLTAIGLDGNKLILRLEESGYPTSVRDCAPYASFNDFQYIDINGSYEQTLQPYLKTSNFQEFLQRSTADCTQEFEKNDRAARLYFNAL